MTPADLTNVTNGINETASLFYTVGGTVLVVFAAMWGFKKVMSLVSSAGSSGPISSNDGSDQDNTNLADYYNSK